MWTPSTIVSEYVKQYICVYVRRWLVPEIELTALSRIALKEVVTGYTDNQSIILKRFSTN